MATYGVTAAMISATANGMSLSSSTRPTQAQVEAWIGQSALRASAAIRAAGADPATVEAATTSEGYALAQQYVTADTAAITIAARDRADGELARMYASRAKDLLTDLRTYAAALGDQRATGEGAPGLTWAPVQYATDTAPTKDAAYWSNRTGQL